MILDTQTTFSEGQSVAAAAGDVVSTNVYDTGSVADVGVGEPFFFYTKMNAALVGAGASIQVVLQDSADNATFADVAMGRAVPVASATANAEILRLRVPVGLRRYLRLVYRISGATTTAGTVSSYVVKDLQAQQYLPTSFTVA